MRRLSAWAGVLFVVLVVAAVSAVVLQDHMYREGAKRAEAAFESYRPPRLSDFGATRQLRITPLVDYHTSGPLEGREALLGEVGLSYLIETDGNRILFDVAHNPNGDSPSPLEHNMAVLGVELDSIDTFFISHNHLDHVGGMQRQTDRTFSIGIEQPVLGHPAVRAFVPEPMSYPGIDPVVAREPIAVAPGVATTGTVPRQLVIGAIDEQSLAVRVAGRGVVLVVGCGHQSIPNLLRRYDQLFDLPLYGIVGGLHLPVPAGRLSMLGLDVQRRLASGDGLLAPLTMEEVRRQMALLEERGLGLVGVGGHDSSDEVIALFAETFGDAYRYVRVGEPIVVAAGAE